MKETPSLRLVTTSLSTFIRVVYFVYGSSGYDCIYLIVISLSCLYMKG